MVLHVLQDGRMHRLASPLNCRVLVGGMTTLSTAMIELKSLLLFRADVELEICRS